jgi:hypothetical protein
MPDMGVRHQFLSIAMIVLSIVGFLCRVIMLSIGGGGIMVVGGCLVVSVSISFSMVVVVPFAH